MKIERIILAIASVLVLASCGGGDEIESEVTEPPITEPVETTIPVWQQENRYKPEPKSDDELAEDWEEVGEQACDFYDNHPDLYEQTYEDIEIDLDAVYAYCD